MDENAKAQFKWKFYRLTVELNLIVLLAAMSIPVFLIIHSSFTLPLIIGMLILALVLFSDFLKKYRETKAWLDAATEKEKDKKQENES
jgi:hypothetical protein